MILSHNHIAYQTKWSGPNKYNGAYYYSREIVKNIIPNVKTNRNWITINMRGIGASDSIVFIHNNINPERYEWLKMYGFKNLVLACGIPETCERVERFGIPIYLPLSVDVEEVKAHKKRKTREVCFAGRNAKRKGIELPEECDYLENIPRDEFLQEMSRYKYVYAVGRTAIEAKVLGCEVLPYDPRFPDPDRWEILDNLDAAKILQEELDKIDGKSIR